MVKTHPLFWVMEQPSYDRQLRCAGHDIMNPEMETKSENKNAVCPECGAPKVDGMTCWEQLGAIGAWEFQDLQLMAEHFITVACYNLQHPAQFADEALAGLRASFIDHLDNGLSVQEIRRRTSRVYEGKRRVLKPESERRPVLRHWSTTIADVYIPDKPEGAAQRVRAWAAAIRSEL